MLSHWDWLPDEIQLKIRQTASANLIQETYHKNRYWFDQRKKAILKLNPGYDLKYFKKGDRVLITQKNKKLKIGTVTSISYNFKYFCRISNIYLPKTRHMYYYKKEKKEYTNPHDIVNIKLLNSWNICICDKISRKCDQCLMK